MSPLDLVLAVLAAPLFIAVVGMTCAMASLLRDAWHSHHPRPEVVERLFPLQHSDLADEARRWLRTQA